ncbi:MAG: leucyl/phenylalanyl-tRNA--protein transferase [Spirochaetaceae bacterium]|nr:leucyl/phenylalanyl-tRNA--protein transferase [Spirochaetaceae bacterium]
MKNRFPYFDESVFFEFPPVERAYPNGLLAMGGNLSPGMLISAYKQGIFPWYSEGDPILWWSPDPRYVLFPDKLHISKSLKKDLKKNLFNIFFNTRFSEIIKECRKMPRPGQDGTWITNELEKAYIKLFDLGYIFCAAVTEPDSNELVAGVYGVKMGKCFFGESMFTKTDNASKYGFVKFVDYLKQEGVDIIDCQTKTDNLERFGAEMIPRSQFIDMIKKGLK